MQDIVREAMKRDEEEQDANAEVSEGDDEFGSPRIVIVGAGGAGNNTVNRLYNIGVDGAETVAINTDKQHLKMIEADTKILVGKSLTQGLGAGGDPSMGERATEMAQGTIKDVLGEADLVFVTAAPARRRSSRRSPKSKVRSWSGWSRPRSTSSAPVQ
jgi:cell division protein FtsZ